MKTVTKKVKDLTPHPKNTRNHTKKQLEEFKRSINKFGIIRPVVVDENDMILAGHGIVLALQEMEREEVPAYQVEGLTENQKVQLMLADNKVFMLGSDDFEKLDQILGEMEDLDIPGYSQEDLEALYGDDTIEEDLENYKLDEKEKQKKENHHDDEKETPADVQREKERVEEEAQRVNSGSNVITCPHCGGKIEIE